MIASDEIHSRVLAALPGAEVEVRDLTGTSDHYEVRVTASEFAGLARIERHRLVYAAVRDVLGGALHALSIRTLAPGE